MKPYDAADNTARCYDLAIRAIRLQKIREGEFAPRPNDSEEMEAYRQYKESLK